MNDTPTPRTDALRTKLYESINTPNIVKYMKTVLHANELETELTAAREELKAVTEQRDRLAEALQGAQAALNPLSGFTKSQHQKHIDVVRDAIRAALEPFRQKP